MRERNRETQRPTYTHTQTHGINILNLYVSHAQELSVSRWTWLCTYIDSLIYAESKKREKSLSFLAGRKCYISQHILDIKCSRRPWNEMYYVSSSGQTFEHCFHFTNTVHYTFWWTPWVTGTRGYGKIRRKKFNVDFGGQFFLAFLFLTQLRCFYFKILFLTGRYL